MKVFIDTSAFMAMILKRETLHAKAVQLYEKYKKTRANLVTSDYILDELFTRCVARAGKYGAKKTIELIDEIIASEELTVLRVDLDIFERAKQTFLKFADQPISFTDATSYELYKVFVIDEVFTFDSDFKKMRLTTSL